jgi:hypothetical protein
MPDPRTVAALYVLKDGPYADREGVDPWPEARDARLYAGPHVVVAHPPCARWGRYAEGGPSAPRTRKVGDDGGCFAAALLSVRSWGGVLEHPEASHAWGWFGLYRPPRTGGWVRADLLGGWTCCVEQGHYGHGARKATWLYLYGLSGRDLPELYWGPSASPDRLRLDQGFPSREARLEAGRQGRCQAFRRQGSRARTLTPEPFADLLLDLARRCYP